MSIPFPFDEWCQLLKSNWTTRRVLKVLHQVKLLNDTSSNQSAGRQSKGPASTGISHKSNNLATSFQLDLLDFGNLGGNGSGPVSSSH